MGGAAREPHWLKLYGNTALQAKSTGLFDRWEQNCEEGVYTKLRRAWQWWLRRKGAGQDACVLGFFVVLMHCI